MGFSIFATLKKADSNPRKRASVGTTAARNAVSPACSGHIDRQHLRDAIVAASPRISSPSDGWFGVAGEQFRPGC
jgi:hypothetical protein